jgi:nitrate reductase gamma subunit
MAAIRRYAIGSYEPTGITRLMFRSNPVYVLVTLVVALFLGFFLFTLKPADEVSRWIFNYLPYPVIHSMGLVIFAFTGISMVWGMVSMILHLKKPEVPESKTVTSPFTAVRMVFHELLYMKRFRDCDQEEDSFWNRKPWFKKPWFVHLSIMWGFIGLLIATSLDFIFKDPATTIWWPSRILGTLAGLSMVYGASQALLYHRAKITKSYRETHLSDLVFLWFLWIAGVTGFWLEVSVALGADHLVNHLVFLVHTVISMELVLLFAFSKFAHVLYRPLALYFAFKSGYLGSGK